MREELPGEDLVADGGGHQDWLVAKQVFWDHLVLAGGQPAPRHGNLALEESLWRVELIDELVVIRLLEPLLVTLVVHRDNLAAFEPRVIVIS